MDKPSNFVLIIGAMKSGTTSLFDILSQHPQICASKIKEPDYFVRSGDHKSQNEYLALWNWNERQHRIALESSVAYTKSPFIRGVPERIYNSGLGKFRFIYFVRDPVARIESQIRHGVFAGWGKSLDEGISDDLIAFTRYATQLDEYLMYFKKGDLLVLTLEEFQNNPASVLTRICEFIDVDKKFEFNNVEEPRNSGQFFESSSLMMRLTQNPIGKYIARSILPFQFKNWLRDKLVKLGGEAKQKPIPGRWRLTETEKERVISMLSSDLKRIHHEYGIDVCEYWNVPEEFVS